ncbi:MAG: chromosome segregation protein [Planctomycetota bacterium]
MRLKKLQLHGFKSFAKKTIFHFDSSISAIVGPNGSGKSNVVEAMRFVLGEQSMKSLRGGATADLIFTGSGTTKTMNRAIVELTFDNHDRIFSVPTTENAKLSLDFDEIVLAREIVRDGSTKYTINGSEVRLKDIMEVIASVNIGASGHHIISQGEADRLLNANPRERKAMLEDALGLKAYQYRIKESERKLERAESNLKETELLRKELAPHLRFLQRQVEKIKKAETLRVELREAYQGYLAVQDHYLRVEHTHFQSEVLRSKNDLAEIGVRLEQHRSEMSTQQERPEEAKIRTHESEIAELSTNRQELSRKLGRIEGMIELAENAAKKSEIREKAVVEKVREFIRVQKSDIEALSSRTNALSATLKQLSTREGIIARLPEYTALLHDFFGEKESAPVVVTPIPLPYDESEVIELRSQYSEIKDKLVGLSDMQEGVMVAIRDLKQALQTYAASTHEREREFFELNTLYNTMQSSLTRFELRVESLSRNRQLFKEELEEAKALIGSEVFGYQDSPVGEVLREYAFEIFKTTGESQEMKRRSIERMKIKLEEMGGGSGGDVLAEYEETVARDQFFEKEIGDVIHSSIQLREVIADLKGKLHTEFVEGLEKISTQFVEFFMLMFGGGGASLSLVTIERRKKKAEDGEASVDELDPEDDEGGEVKEQGIEISVALPRKKVQNLQMLSGGERSLTSIALLFALSQVNPPPFLVLDETDAALDESNSQKYGDMIERLSHVSQLMVVTHNRETMSRAHVLYGVTIGADSSSQLLSVKLEDAEQYAK